MPPARQYLSIHPYGRRYRIWDIAPCPCLSIHFSNPEIWIWDRPPARRGRGMCPLRPPDPSEISPRQCLSIPFPNPKYRLWDLTPARQCLSIPCSRRYRMWDIAPRQYLSIPVSSPKYRMWGIWDMAPGQFLIFPKVFRLFWLCDFSGFFDFSVFAPLFNFLGVLALFGTFWDFSVFFATF